MKRSTVPAGPDVHGDSIPKWVWGVAALLGALYVGFLNPFYDYRSFNAHDPSVYLEAARSIWRGDGYGIRHADAYFPIKLQPPGLSLVLAPVVGFFGVNLAAVKLTMVILAGLVAWACFDCFREYLGSSRDAAIATLMLMASPVVFRLGHQVLTDLPLILFSSLALSSVQRYLRPGQRLASPWLLVACLSTVGAYFFKNSGLAVLLGGWCLLLRRSWRTPGMAAKLGLWSVLVAIPVLAWQWRCQTTPSVGFYGRSMADWYLLKDPYIEGSARVSFLDMLVRVRHVFARGMVPNVASALVSPLYFSRSQAVSFLLGLPVVLWLAWQWLKSWRRPSVLEGFMLVGALTLLVKHQGSAPRYWVWLSPGILVYAFRAIATWPLPAWRERLLQAFVALSLVATIVVALDQWRDPYGSVVTRDYDQIARQARTSFAPDSRCLAPMSIHWQALTAHRCLVGSPDHSRLSAASIEYAVVLKDPMRWRTSGVTGLPQDILISANGITRTVEAEPGAFVPALENATFRLMRAARLR